MIATAEIEDFNSPIEYFYQLSIIINEKHNQPCYHAFDKAISLWKFGQTLGNKHIQRDE